MLLFIFSMINLQQKKFRCEKYFKVITIMWCVVSSLMASLVTLGCAKNIFDKIIFFVRYVIFERLNSFLLKKVKQYQNIQNRLKIKKRRQKRHNPIKKTSSCETYCKIKNTTMTDFVSECKMTSVTRRSLCIQI